MISRTTPETLTITKLIMMKALNKLLVEFFTKFKIFRSTKTYIRTSIGIGEGNSTRFRRLTHDMTTRVTSGSLQMKESLTTAKETTNFNRQRTESGTSIRRKKGYFQSRTIKHADVKMRNTWLL